MRLPIERISIRHLLSFGELGPFDLTPLNVLIGPNGSGKSNLIETIGLLAALPTGIGEPIVNGGGIANWLWKGSYETTASVEVAGNTLGKTTQPYEHRIEFGIVDHTFRVADEMIKLDQAPSKRASRPLLEYKDGEPSLRVPKRPNVGASIDRANSILWRDQPALAHLPFDSLARLYRSFRVYRGRSLDHAGFARQTPPADQFGEYLLPDASNLGAVLNRIWSDDPGREVLRRLRIANDNIDDLFFNFDGKIYFYLREKGLNSMIPAGRISDGTFRWLCLLAILYSPAAPTLLCLEEPEIGLHPDLIVELASLLKETSQRAQLVVTTHSQTLVDSLTDDPESVVICEKADNQTTLRRLEEPKLRDWLERYGLGNLWQSNQLGGNRW